MLNAPKKEEEIAGIEEEDDEDNDNDNDNDDGEEEIEENDDEDHKETSHDPKSQNAKRRKRRTKKDLNGREFTCKCGKSYLSITALKGHQKQKHKNKLKNGIESERKRGRPRKYIFTDEYPKEQVFFFDAKSRKPSAKNPIVIQTVMNSMAAFVEQFHINANNNLLFLLREYKPITKPLEERKTDDVIYEYLLQTKHLTNPKYYELILKVLLLLREYYNNTNSDQYYSLNQSIEQLPLITNSFLDDYLVSNNYFGISHFDQSEIAEIVLNFSLWIHENGYSTYVINKVVSK